MVWVFMHFKGGGVHCTTLHPNGTMALWHLAASCHSPAAPAPAPPAGLPLLQPELRQHVKRPFAAAAKALEVAASPLHRLRAQLHLEIGKCEVADDALIKVGPGVPWHGRSSICAHSSTGIGSLTMHPLPQA